MKRTCVLLVLWSLYLVCANAEATLNIKIEYELIDLGGGQFEYEYLVRNDNLSGDAIEEFTIWFDVGSYDNLTITTEEPLAGLWDEIILEKTGFGLPIGYDAKSLNGGIPPTESEGIFSVSFDWLGTGIPGRQPYEIINRVTFETIYFGYTVPEPATLLLLGLGAVILRRKRS